MIALVEAVASAKVEALEDETRAVVVAPTEELDWDVLSSLRFHETALVPWKASAAD